VPVVELPAGDPEPGDNALDGDLRALGESADEVDNLVADVVGNPDAV
jgi:hypothetical protein